MAYRLDLAADLPDTARTTLRQQLDRSVAVLRERHADDPVGAIHDARKRVKKSRALLRLVRPGLPKRTYRQENRALRDAARQVSHVRDADVMVETVDALRERFAGQVPATAFRTLRTKLNREAANARAQSAGELDAEFADALATVAGRIDDLQLDDGRWSVARKGLARAYRRGRKAFDRADQDPTTETLHEWRKRVKDLDYQQRLLKAAWPAVLGAQAEEAHALSDLLGDDHDLAVLADRLREDRKTRHTDVILELIDRRRAELLAELRTLGRRVYAEKPKAFIRRVDRYRRIEQRA